MLVLHVHNVFMGVGALCEIDSWTQVKGSPVFMRPHLTREEIWIWHMQGHAYLSSKQLPTVVRGIVWKLASWFQNMCEKYQGSRIPRQSWKRVRLWDLFYWIARLYYKPVVIKTYTVSIRLGRWTDGFEKRVEEQNHTWENNGLFK